MVGLASSKRKLFFLLLLFVGAFCVRFLFFRAFLQHNPIQLAYDSGHYHTIACSVVQGKGISNPDGSPHFYRLPGYPLFLAACYWLGGGSVERMLVLQQILASCIPLLVFVLFLQLFPGAYIGAWAAACVAVVHPGFLILSGLVMSETLFVFLLLVFLILFFISWSRPHAVSYVCGAGLLLGITSLVRPVGIWLLALCIIILLCRPLHWSTRLFQALCFFGTWLIPVGWWVLRNFLHTGVFFLHTFSGPHLLNHGAVRIFASACHIPYAQAQRRVYDDLRPKKSLLHEWEWSPAAEHYAFICLIEHPWYACKLCCVNIFKTIFSLYASELLCIDSGGVLPSYDAGRSYKEMVLRFVAPSVHNKWIIPMIYGEIILHLLILLGAFGWCVMSVVNPRCITPQLYSMFALSSILILLSCVCGFARLRLPVEPFFIMLAMSFWSERMHGKRVV
jgi:4-amino-4-deoxy-L-arabinose transferase-like glycosyltransferase